MIMAGIYVNPFTDVGFKIIFGQEASKELLITLLNELLAGEHIVEDLCFLDKENYEQNVHNRDYLRFICLTSIGEYIIVEMQCHDRSHFLDQKNDCCSVCRAIRQQVCTNLLKILSMPFPSLLQQIPKSEMKLWNM